MLIRYLNILSLRFCKNIKRARAAIELNVIKEFYCGTEMSFGRVGPAEIVNEDETTIVDDPDIKKTIFRRRKKPSYRIVDSSKTSFSITFCGSASGKLLRLRPYVVYREERLIRGWTEILQRQYQLLFVQHSSSRRLVFQSCHALLLQARTRKNKSFHRRQTDAVSIRHYSL